MSANDTSTMNGTGAPAVRPRRAHGTLLRRLDPKASPYLFVAPFFVVFGVFGLFPLVYTAYVSLTDRNLLNPVSHFIGLHNFVLLIHDSYFWNAVENTFGIWFLSTVPQLSLALAIAHVLNTRLRVRTSVTPSPAADGCSDRSSAPVNWRAASSSGCHARGWMRTDVRSPYRRDPQICRPVSYGMNAFGVVRYSFQ